jgi:ubiquinone biosynthesis protein
VAPSDTIRGRRHPQVTPYAPISRRIRHVHRYVELLEVFARYGFADLLQELKLDGLIERGRNIITRKPRANFERLTRAERIRKALEELGPTYVKMGQVLSTRPDLIPQDWADEFSKLQYNVPGVPFEAIRSQLLAEFPGTLDEVFLSIEEQPIAAASMAQVHRATLHDNTKIVIKVLRPGIRETTESDMDVLRTVAHFTESHFSNLGYSPIEIVEEFAKELVKEMDLTHEGQVTERLRSYFDNDEGIVFPKVYWEATTRGVLALEEIHGVLVSRLKDGQVDKEDRRRAVENGARAVLRQCLEIGFFHADPHPGNLFILPEGRVAFIDCGMTGEIDARTMQQLADLVSGIVSGDLERVIGVVAALADVPPDKLEERAFRADVQSIVSRFYNVPLDKLNLGGLLQEFFAKLRAHRIRCPADLMFLIKALTTIEAVGRVLDPSFELVTFARPYVERLVQRRYTISAIRKRLIRSLVGYTELLEDLPGEIRPWLTHLRRNKVTINLEHRGLHRLTHAVEHASRNISFALIIAAMLVGSSILVNAARHPGLGSLTAIGIAGFVASAILVILMIISNRRYRGD